RYELFFFGHRFDHFPRHNADQNVLPMSPDKVLPMSPGHTVALAPLASGSSLFMIYFPCLVFLQGTFTPFTTRPCWAHTRQRWQCRASASPGAVIVGGMPCLDVGEEIDDLASEPARAMVEK